MGEPGKATAFYNRLVVVWGRTQDSTTKDKLHIALLDAGPQQRALWDHAEEMRGLLDELTGDDPNSCECYGTPNNIILCTWCKTRTLLAKLDGGG